MSVSRNYFQKFPSISYNDYVVRDISLRAKLGQYLQEAGLALLPYSVKDGERADNIADFYYGDPFYAWTIYLVNNIIDPYSQWPKDQQTFTRYIEETYGSYEASLDEIVRYEVNWAEDTSILSPAQYEVLPEECKKYWDAQFGYNRQVISYVRREVDHVMLNNRIDQVTVVSSNGDVDSLTFQLGERVWQYNYLGDVAAKATIISVDSTTEANVVPFTHTNSTSFDIDFSSGNSTIYVKSTLNVLPFANVVGTGIPTGAYVKHIVDGTHVTLSLPPTGSPASNSSYNVANPAAATLTVLKVDFSDVIFASNSTLATPDAFFTYETAGTYRDEGNYLVGRKSAANAVVLTHQRLDTNATANDLLSNSHLSINELKYWKPVTAYDDAQQRNDLNKEIFVLDANMIGRLDDALETLLKNA